MKGDVRLISHSVDPENDTPSQLKHTESDSVKTPRYGNC